MKLTIYQVDAFTKRLFGGNPAAVCPLEKWLDPAIMQNIAMENNLSETAFFVPEGEQTYGIRWFTPTTEVDLCGHATLASAYVLFHFLQPTWQQVQFNSRSGPLRVHREGELLVLDFPAIPPDPIIEQVDWSMIINAKPLEIYGNKDYLMVLESEADVRNCQVNLPALSQLERRALIITAPGQACDFVSRFFAPKVGVSEDPVTGSAHSMLIPYWAQRLNKAKLHAMQLSARGGELFCELKENRVFMGGYAVLYLQGMINLIL